MKAPSESFSSASLRYHGDFFRRHHFGHGSIPKVVHIRAHFYRASAKHPLDCQLGTFRTGDDPPVQSAVCFREQDAALFGIGPGPQPVQPFFFRVKAEIAAGYIKRGHSLAQFARRGYFCVSALVIKLNEAFDDRFCLVFCIQLHLNVERELLLLFTGFQAEPERQLGNIYRQIQLWLGVYVIVHMEQGIQYIERNKEVRFLHDHPPFAL